MEKKQIADIGVFGGSGFYKFLDNIEELRVETPYGAPPQQKPHNSPAFNQLQSKCMGNEIPRRKKSDFALRSRKFAKTR